MDNIVFYAELALGPPAGKETSRQSEQLFKTLGVFNKPSTHSGHEQVMLEFTAQTRKDDPKQA